MTRDGAVQAVLFDFGNTLFAHESLADTIGATCRLLGAEVTPAWCAQVAGRIDEAAQQPDELRRGRDLDASVWHDRWHVLYSLADAHVVGDAAVGAGLGAALYGAMHDPLQWHPYAATTPTLRALAAAGVPVAVVSNTGWDVRAVFEAQNLADVVASFVLSYEVGVVKPSAAIFERACHDLGVPPNRVLMVGDDPVVDAGAVRAGLRTLLLPARSPRSSNGLEAAVQIAVEE